MSTTLSRFRLLLPLLLLIFIDEMGNGLFYPILTPIIFDPIDNIFHATTSMALRQFHYGLTLAIFPIMMFCSAPILGDLSDYYGRKRVLILSLLGTALGYLLSGFAVSIHSYPLLLLGRAIDGLTAGNFPIAQAAIIDVSKPNEKTENLSLVVFAISLGFIVGPMFAALLSNPHILSQFTLATPLYAAGLLSALNLLMIIYSFHETHKPHSADFRFDLKKAVSLFLAAFKEPSIRRLSCILFFLLFGWGTYIQFINIYLYRAYGVGKDGLAAFSVTMAVTFAISSTVVIKWLLKRYSNIAIISGSLLISALGVLVTILTDHLLYAWLCLIPASMGIALTHATTMSLYSDSVGDEQQGWVMGVSSSVVAVAIAVSAISDGLLANVNLLVPLWVAFVTYMIAYAFAWGYPEHK